MKPPPNLQVENRLIPHPDSSPNELREKIEAYERENFILQQIYATSARMFNADQPLTDVYASVLAYVTQPPRNLALRTPRILLLGFVGSGRKTQAKLLAGKYGLVPVDCSALINQEIASVSLLGKAMKTYVERNMAVPDAIVVEAVKARLTQPDCTTRGWILYGYPRSKQQAELLDAEGLTPNRVFALDISHICAAERLTGRRIDPVTGQRFHLSNRPFGDDMSVQMLQNPQDRECVIGSKLATFAAHKEQLYEYYASNLIHIHADVDVHTVFEEIEAGLVNPLPQDKSTNT
ncbi:adenylate kinase 8 [Clonorchis sinensis]|nr:adenylate kinase 8 [Clonorchis sinensis]